MFDFVNYTYSGLLSIIAALIGLACPLVIGRIEAIDKRYHSTLLAKRFIKEPSFVVFPVLIIINIALAIIVPFLLDGSKYGRWWILLQSAMMTLLLASLLWLFVDMLLYMSPKELQERILSKFFKAKKAGKKEAEKYFNQWVEIVPILLSSADDNIAQSVYDAWNKCVMSYYIKEHKWQEFDDYFLVGLTRINESLCKSERRLMSVNNGNGIVNSLQYLDMPMPEKYYRYLWKNLLLQVYYNRDEWLLSFWSTASQRYQLFMKDCDKKEKWQFFEFNIFFVAMLLQQNKYELVKKLLTYTNSKPETYPLVPSTMGEILETITTIYKKSEQPVFYYYEAKYPMPDMQGINDGRILGAAYMYLALLMYRVYTLVWYYGEDVALHTGMYIRGKYLNELEIWGRTIQVLKYWLKVINKNEELLSVVNFKEDIIRTRSEENHSHIPTPEEIVKDLEEMTERAKEDTKKHQPLDAGKIEASYKEAVRIISNALLPYKPLIEREDFDGEEQTLDCSQTMPFPREAYLKNPSVSHANIEETMTYPSINKFMNEISRTLFTTKRRKSYTISIDNIVQAIKSLKLGKKYVILSNGVNWDYIAERCVDVIKIGEDRWQCNEVEIYELPCYQRVFERMLYVIRKEDIPFIQFKSPLLEQKEKYHLLQKDSDYEIWASILDLKEYPDLHERVQSFGVQIDKNVLYTIGWQPVLKTRKGMEVTTIHVWYKLYDEGNPDDVNSVEAIDKKRKEK